MPLNKSLRTLWEAAGYDTRMGSAEVLPPPPSHLVRAYHVTSSVHAINAIALQRLKVSRLSDLNDPFEFLGLMWRDLRHRPQIQALKAEVDRTTGLLCFSSNWVNPVLWSHYGDRHRGVCLGFDLPRSLAQPVTYCAKRMATTHAMPSRITKALEETLFFTKFDHWQYESEIRMPVPLGTTKREGSLHFLPFVPNLALAEVILGEDCTLSLAEVRQLVSSISPSTITFKARLAGKSYNVVPSGESVP